MIHESKTSPTGDAASTADGAGRLPAESSEPAQGCCAACGARLQASARFCAECGSAQAPPAADKTAATCSQFGGSSDDLAQLLSARGQVVACPRCDELNNSTAAYCGHCGQRLTAPMSEVHAEQGHARTSATALRSALPARRYGPAIALALLVVATLALWPGQSPTAPAGSAAQGATSRSVPTAPVEPPLSTAQSPAPGAAPEEQEKPSPPLPPPAAEQQRGPREGAHKKVAKAAARRASAQPGIDELYRQRAAERCAEGLNGLVCRETVRFALCDGKWTQEARSGMEICRLNP